MNLASLIDKLRAYKPEPGRFKPCKVMFRLGSPVILSMPWIMLDGLLAYALAQDIFGPEWHELDFRKPLPIAENLALPVKRIELQGTYLYAASCSRFETPASSTVRVRKRVSVDDLAYLDSPPKRVDGVRGDLKSYDMQFPAITAKVCTFHAVGDPGEIERLCGSIDCLGKKRALGSGRVTGFHVEPENVDRSFFLEPGGLLNKPVPVASLTALGLGQLAGKPVAMLASKPPYWDPSGMVPCVCPEGF